MNFSFNREKVQKECYKLADISNLGGNAITDYMTKPRLNKAIEHDEFSITEIAFLYRISYLLSSPHKAWGKEFLDWIFRGKEMESNDIVAFYPFPLCKIDGAKQESVTMFDFYEFCSEGIKGLLPYLEAEKHDEIVDVFVKTNLELIGTKIDRMEASAFTTIMVAAWLCNMASNSNDMASMCFDSTFDKNILILGEIIDQSPFMRSIALEVIDKYINVQV